MMPVLTFLQDLPWWSFLPLVGLALHFSLRVLQHASMADWSKGGNIKSAFDRALARRFGSKQSPSVGKIQPRRVIPASRQIVANSQLPIVIGREGVHLTSRVSNVAKNIPEMPMVYWINLAVIAFFTTVTGLSFALIPVLILALFFLDMVSKHSVYPAVRREVVRRRRKRQKGALKSRNEATAKMLAGQLENAKRVKRPATAA